MKKTLLLGSLLLCSPAFTAQAADDNLMQDVFLLDPVTVTGQLEEEKLDRTTAIVVERNRSNNVADYLVRDPEISFKRKAAFGDSSDIISIRGMESKRIMLNLDGRNIGSTGMSGGNYIDFGTIPLDNIERIEVIKGGSSVEYGNSALGGVINARTRKPTETPYLSAYATMGGWNDVYDFHNVRGSYAQKFRALGVSLGLIPKSTWICPGGAHLPSGTVTAKQNAALSAAIARTATPAATPTPTAPASAIPSTATTPWPTAKVLPVGRPRRP